MSDSNKKCGVLIFNNTYDYVLLVQEKYTNNRLHEWVQWKDWKADRLVKHMNTYTQKQIDMFDLEWRDEWEAGKITIEKVKEWLIQKRCIPDQVLKGIGKWGIPKGHVKNGESYIEAVKREIKEEIGIAIPNAKLYYFLHEKNMQRNIYVTTLSKNISFIPGYEINDIQWISIEDLNRNKKNENYNCTVHLPLYYSKHV
jgi:ADP-ribose pyrophosphatase YjhB (NUDIX family)